MNEAISPFVVTATDFAKTRALAADVFLLDGRGLPGQVFVEGFNNFRFLEFDVLLSKDFWHVLSKFAEKCGDKDISITVHDPDPISYYFEHFQRYAALRFARSASSDDYKKALLMEPKGSPADALQYVSSVMSWCGGSRRWGFWGERDFGVGIAATSDAKLPFPEIEGVRWFDLETALSSFIAPNFESEIVPLSFATKLRENFGS